MIEREIKRKVFNKRSPANEEEGRFFIPFPSDARHYLYHPKMEPEYLFLYTLIIDYYNPEEGRAFPSLVLLEMVYKKHRDTVSKHLDILKEVGLIDFERKQDGYIPLEPLNQEEFFEKYPDANRCYLNAIEKRDKQQAGSRERMRKLRKRNGYD